MTPSVKAVPSKSFSNLAFAGTIGSAADNGASSQVVMIAKVAQRSVEIMEVSRLIPIEII